MKQDIDNWASTFATRTGLLHCLKTTWTLVHKRLKILPSFLATLRKFCIVLHYQALQTEINKWNSTKLCRTVESKIALTICRRKVWIVPPKKWDQKLLHLFSFRQIWDLMANIFRTQSDLENWERSFKNTRDLLDRPKISWTLVHKRLKWDWSFYSPSVNSAFCFIARHCTWQTEPNQTSPNGRR